MGHEITIRYIATLTTQMGSCKKKTALLVDGKDLAAAVLRVYSKWTDKYLSDYNLPVYYQPRDYIVACFLAKKILD